MIEVSAVQPEDAAAVWNNQREVLERGLNTGQGDGTSPAELLNDIETGFSQMWAVHEGEDIYGVVIMSLVDFVRTRKLMVHLVAGRDSRLWGDEVQRLLLELKSETGASCIEASCRPGAAKILASKDWRKKAVIMELI